MLVIFGEEEKPTKKRNKFCFQNFKPKGCVLTMDYFGDALIKVRLLLGLQLWLRSAYSKNNANNVNKDGSRNNKYVKKTQLGVCPDLPLKNEFFTH